MFLWISNMAEFEPVAKSITMRVMATWDHRFCSRCRSSHFEGLSTRSCWKRHKLIKSYFRRSISRIDAREFGVKEMEIPEKDRLRPFCWFCELGKYDASHASLEYHINYYETSLSNRFKVLNLSKPRVCSMTDLVRVINFYHGCYIIMIMVIIALWY